uniref:Prolyl 4-hydroxylase 9 n=1 Tax=Ananas comosus var. bracteatus TaxID=296719 RepID=A0A6V7QEC2_ANACO|nr:unnamed protein product [Ananas comosus var. bracteatus]
MIPFSAAPTKENKGRSLWLLLVRAKLGLPVVVLSCSIFFLVGFFGSTLLSQDASEEALPRERLTEVNGEVESEWPAMPYGDTGDPRPILIPFQVLSWKPRALYFPQFATAEQCQTVVKIAKSRLAPSTLALRKGETEQTTKGIRTSSGTFLSAADDPSGALGQMKRR